MGLGLTLHGALLGLAWFETPRCGARGNTVNSVAREISAARASDDTANIDETISRKRYGPVSAMIPPAVTRKRSGPSTARQPLKTARHSLSYPAARTISSALHT